MSETVALRLTKADAALLERLFTAEITPGHPGPVQLGKKAGERLTARGLATFETITLPRTRDFPWPMTVSGYVLTHTGRMAYGTWAAENPDGEGEDDE